MAARSLFFTLRRKSYFNINSQSTSSISIFNSRSLSYRSADIVEVVEEESVKDSDDLRSKIFRLRLPKRSATNVIQRWIGDGNSVSVSELRSISKELRKLQRYKHALEISEWMFTHDKTELSDSDYAIRIDLMTKVFGIDAAERYFEALPLSAKTTESCTALLHSYAAAKLTERAEDLYEWMKESNILLNALAYNEMMTLYISIGQLEKVSSVVEELKHKNVQLDLFTYNLWISSCAATLNIDGVHQILNEMTHDPGFNEGWKRYINLTNIYISCGHLVNSKSDSLVEAKGEVTQRELITYDFLVFLYAGLGNKERVDQIWKSLRSTSQKMTSRNYICIVSSYLMLGKLKEVEDVIEQWTESVSTDYDVRICHGVLDEFVKVGFVDKAEAFRLILHEREHLEDKSK